MRKVNFPRAFLPSEVEEGDYLRISIERDADATAAAEDEALALLNQ